jgi:hypothetical protein
MRDFLTIYFHVVYLAEMFQHLFYKYVFSQCLLLSSETINILDYIYQIMYAAFSQKN